MRRMSRKMNRWNWFDIIGWFMSIITIYKWDINGIILFRTVFYWKNNFRKRINIFCLTLIESLWMYYSQQQLLDLLDRIIMHDYSQLVFRNLWNSRMKFDFEREYPTCEMKKKIKRENQSKNLFNIIWYHF
jgi:hypothetical protein